jgi:Spy/CpxP family protein refolding chaperone
MQVQAKASLRSAWDGQGLNSMAVGLLNDHEAFPALGISKEQADRVQDGIRKNFAESRNNAEIVKLHEESRTIQQANGEFLQNANEETMNKFIAIQEKLAKMQTNSFSDVLNSVLTHEQKQKIGEAYLTSLGKIAIVSPSMFDVLNLTDVQKQEMEKIKKELEPEFERNLETFSSNSVILQNKVFEESLKHGGGVNADRIAHEKLMASDQEYKKIVDENQTTGKAFSVKFKEKMFSMLTDTQKARIKELTDNPPEHVKEIQKKWKEDNLLIE